MKAVQPLNAAPAELIFFMPSKMSAGSDSSDVQLRNIWLMVVTDSKSLNSPLGNGLERRTAAEYVSGRYAFSHFPEVVRRRLHELRAVFPDRGDGLQRDAVFSEGIGSC